MRYVSAYIYSPKLYRQANRLHVRTHPRMRLFLYSFLLAFPLLAVGFAFMAWTAFRQGDSDAAHLWEIGTGAMLLYSLVALLRRRLVLRKRMREGLVGDQESPRYVTITDDGFEQRLPGKAETTIQWAAFCGFSHDDAIALLYTNHERFFIVTRSDAEASTWEETCLFLRQKIRSNGVRPC